MTLVRCGGHFAGSSGLHWAGGAGGKGALFTGDTITVVPEPRWMSFMYSYPNLIPLPAREVRRIAGSRRALRLRPHVSALVGPGLPRNAKARLAESVERYIALSRKRLYL